MKLEPSTVVNHQHYCDIAGHGWECSGTTIRRLDIEPSVCLCRGCGVPLKDGDHTRCKNCIEVVTCPEHREEELRRMEEARKEHERCAAEFGFDDKWKRMKELPDGPDKHASAQEIVEWLFR